MSAFYADLMSALLRISKLPAFIHVFKVRFIRLYSVCIFTHIQRFALTCIVNALHSFARSAFMCISNVRMVRIYVYIKLSVLLLLQSNISIFLISPFFAFVLFCHFLMNTFFPFMGVYTTKARFTIESKEDTFLLPWR